MDKPTRRKYRFPWRDGNRFRLLVDGDEFFEAMLAAIEGARRFVLLEMYLFESGQVADRFIKALGRAQERGTAVFLLLDDYGARGLNSTDRTRLLETGVGLTYYNPIRFGRLRANLFRDHRKLLLVDGTIAYTGGAGIVDAFAPGLTAAPHWHEIMIEAQGPCAVDWQVLFTENWNRWNERPLKLPDAAPHSDSAQTGRVVQTRARYHNEVIRSFIKRIRSAEQRAWLATAYFVPSRKVRQTLQRAARRGVDVRLLLPGPLTDHPWARQIARRYYERLLRHGVRIFEYQPRFFHAKALLADHWVSIGSSNVDRWDFAWNLDANQEVDDAAFAHTVRSFLERDFELSREYTFDEWFQRAWTSRLRERFWGWFATLLAWLTTPRRKKGR